jgi:hypothetical protein
MSRADHVHCVLLGYVAKDAQGREVPDHNKTWCGRTLSSEWHFTDPTHALLSTRHGDRVQICPECAVAMIQQIQDGMYT